jgi:hypothetical protein
VPLTSVEPRGLEPLTPCLQSKCATCCAMAPDSQARPKAARPTPDSTPWHIARTNAENFPPAELSLAISRSVRFTRSRLE